MTMNWGLIGFAAFIVAVLAFVLWRAFHPSASLPLSMNLGGAPLFEHGQEVKLKVGASPFPTGMTRGGRPLVQDWKYTVNQVTGANLTLEETGDTEYPVSVFQEV